MADTPPTPTVIESDRQLARRWHRCNMDECGYTRRRCEPIEQQLASQIAAAREAWGREVVAELEASRESHGYGETCAPP